MGFYKGFSIYYQHDSMQCGIASLQMICKHFGRFYSLEKLSQLCHSTTEGVSAIGIQQAAMALGLHSICVRVTVDELCQFEQPCILHWNQKHFVVLYKTKNKKIFYVADPSKGRINYKRDDFLKHWKRICEKGENKGVAIFFKTTPKFYTYTMADTGNEKQHHSFRFYLYYLKNYRKQLMLVVLGLAIGSMIQLVLPILTQSIVDVGIQNKDIGFVWLILLAQMMLTVSRTVIDFIRRWLLLRISMNINISLINDFFTKLIKLPMSFFDTKLVGDLMQRMNDHSRVNKFLTQQTLSITFSLFSFIVFSVVLLFYSKIVFCIFLIGTAFYGLWKTLFLKYRKKIDDEFFEQQAMNNNKTYEFITSMQEIKLQNCELRKRKEWKSMQKSLLAIQMKSLKLQQIQDAGGIFINEIKNMVITVCAATAVITGNMTIGMMLAVQYIIGQLNSPVSQLMNVVYSLQDVKISLERINEIHQMDDENGNEGTNTSIDKVADGIHISNITFKYNPHAFCKTIDDVTIHIPHGKTTAIVGASGSGKTTLIKLLLGYYPILEGQIDIGGTDIKQLNKKWWRRQCGVVMQDGVIFAESIARNIAVDNKKIDTARLEKAAEIACIKDYIMTLPLKFDTHIGHNGIGLSQGQKQRVLIARAVYKNPNYIFLDEATNSLDANNERLIINNLYQFYKGKTVVVVAHRLSTVKNADQIIVLDHGRVVEKGNHFSLSAKQGVYYNLVKNQLELGS